MAFTYTGDPSSSELDEVRFLIGDTDDTDPLLQDEEIQYTINSFGPKYAAATVCCDALAAGFAREVDNSLGPSNESASQRAKAFQLLSDRYRNLTVGISAPTSASAAMGSLQPKIFDKGLMSYATDIEVEDD